MRLLGVFLGCIFFFCQCAKKETVNEEHIEAMKYPVEWLRFDEAFSHLSEATFDDTQKKFPLLLHRGVSKEQWLQKANDSLLRVVHHEVAQQFGDLSPVKNQVDEVLKRVHYYFPSENPNKVITLVSEVDTDHQVVYTDSLVLLSLDTYLGAKHRFYSVFDSYRLRNFEPKRIPIDVAMAVANKKVQPMSNPTLLEAMVVEGKKRMLLDSLVPEISDTLRLNYTSKEWEWAKANEAQIWRYFVENKMLYDNTPKLMQRFINPAPFSKFYLSFDKESPGSIGAFIGYQIVKAYQDKKQQPLGELLLTEPTKLFNESNYKPKK